MPEKKITFNLIPRSLDEIAKQMEGSQAGTFIALTRLTILPNKWNEYDVLRSALINEEGFKLSHKKDFELSKSLDTEDCNIKAFLSPSYDKRTGEQGGYTATVKYDPACTERMPENELNDKMDEFITMLERYFLVNKLK